MILMQKQKNINFKILDVIIAKACIFESAKRSCICHQKEKLNKPKYAFSSPL